MVTDYQSESTDVNSVAICSSTPDGQLQQSVTDVTRQERDLQSLVV